MLQRVINEASTNTIYGMLSMHSPRMNDEKELYGC
jgi:hypothetical protein